MKSKKLGPFLLSGLIIGPILGSGIILLPPLAQEAIGDYAFLAWILVMFINFLFAYIFGKLSIEFPGEQGVGLAVERAYGKYIKYLTSNFLILAGSLGPVAVLMTAGEYLNIWFTNGEMKTELYGIGLLLFGFIILLNNITSVGKIAFVFSTLIAIILFSGGLSSVPYLREDQFFNTPFYANDFGYTILLLFWAVVGWEIIGNYSIDIENREKTIPKAVFFSAIIIAIIYLTVAGAIQWIDTGHLEVNSFQQNWKVGMILVPLFGSFSIPLIALITTILCVSTYLLVVGGVSRLISSLAQDGLFPKFMAFRTKTNVPTAGITIVAIIHMFVFTLLYIDFVSLKQIVIIANAFFISNALLGILAAFKMFSKWFVRVVSSLLTLILITILFFSSKWVIIIIFIIVFYFVYLQFNSNKSKNKSGEQQIDVSM